MKKKEHGDVLVVGAGIAGVCVAVNLAEMGQQVFLIDKNPYVGGRLIQLDHQFPNNFCGMCRILPTVEKKGYQQSCLRVGLTNENIKFMPMTEVISVSGEIGNFRVDLHQRSSRVSHNTCIGCGKCLDVCSVEVPNAFNAGAGMRKAIYCPLPYQPSNKLVIDTEACTLCGECEKICPQQAINLNAKDITKIVSVQAIVLATGYELYKLLNEQENFGFDHPNVVDSLEFERMLSGTGPYHGTLKRPSDQRAPGKIAWIQCVGSRDLRVDGGYCSSTCCMISIKQAMLAKKQSQRDLETAIFYMDLRAFGKGGETYRQIAEQEYGVRFVRNRIHSINSYPDKHELTLRYIDSKGNLCKEDFDIVVSACGQKPGRRNAVLAELCGIDLNSWGFFSTKSFYVGHTGKPGVFVAGATTGPLDISETIINAEAVAAETILSISSLFQTPCGSREGTVVPLFAPKSKGVPSTQRALVVGGGIAGMVAALAIADQGFPVDIVEISSSLGGNLNNIRNTLEGGSPKPFLESLTSRINKHDNVKVHLNSRVTNSTGHVGSFTSVIDLGEGRSLTISHGVTVIATGGKEYTTTSYGYGTRKDILSQNDLEGMINKGELDFKDLKRIVMIQCVDSRETDRNYCSRICCLNALKYSLYIKKHNPSTEIYILYRDMMSYGFYERFYTEARRSGVIFIPYDKNNKPDVNTEGAQVIVKCHEPILQKTIEIKTDLLILGTGVVPSSISDTKRVFDITVDRWGFISEADYKWMPVETARQGIFVCGLARCPCTSMEAIAMGKAAAMKAIKFLADTNVVGEISIASVRESLCMGCKICVGQCAFEAIRFLESKKKAMVNSSLCRGCGSCTVACPVNAIELIKNSEPGFSEKMIIAA